jgi:hypothetical protein
MRATSLYTSYFTLILTVLLMTVTSHAWTERTIREPDPFSFTPSDLGLQDFKIEGSVLWEWLPGSFEWVRSDRRILDRTFFVARAKAIITIPLTAKITYLDQTILPGPDGKAELLLLMTQEHDVGSQEGKRNEFWVEDFETKKRTRAWVKFAPRAVKERLVFDSNCSGLPIKVVRQKLDKSWLNFSCRSVHPFGSALDQGAGYSNKLDLDFYWLMEDGPEFVQINGRPVTLSDGVSSTVVADHRTQTLIFKRGEDEVELEVNVPSRFHPLGVSLGIGPYSHKNVVRAFPTLYASYFFNEQLKAVFFGWAPIQANPEIDLGLYLVAEQFRGLDERLLVNLLLGSHTLSFLDGGTRRFAFSAPQGIELIFRDTFAKGKHFMLGGFFYPLIQERSYVNTWVRYGGSTFLEINFIQWQEPLRAGGTYGAKSFGLSLGFPLFRAF